MIIWHQTDLQIGICWRRLNGEHLNSHADNMRSADSNFSGVFNVVLLILSGWRNYGRRGRHSSAQIGQGNATAWGAKFDTIADIFFVLAVLIKIIGSVVVPSWLLILISIIAIIKAVNIIVGFIRCHRFATVHSVWNKVCGIIVFVPPLFIGSEYAWQAKALVVIFACIIASVAAIQESVYIIKGYHVE